MAAIAPKERLTLEVAHVNYRLRGTDSRADEALVRKEALRHGLPCHVKRPRVPKGASEEALRDLRYAFFETLARKRGAAGVLIAHHEDDQAETFLLRLLRGTGPTGLSGMRPTNGFRRRPFLGIPKTDILRYLEAEKIPFREDASNRDPRYLRNRIRHELLPLLEEKYQPAIRKRLARTAALFAETEETSSLPLPVAQDGEGYAFSRTDFLALEPAAARALLRKWCRELSGKYPTSGQIAEMEKLLKSRKPKRQKMEFRGLKLHAIGDRVRLLKSPV